MSSATANTNFYPFPLSPSFPSTYSRRGLPPLNFGKTQQKSLAARASRHTGGLRTPPSDNMSATYQNPILSNSYESHVALARQPGSFAPADRTVYDATMHSYYRTQPHSYPHQQSQSQPQPQPQPQSHQLQTHYFPQPVPATTVVPQVKASSSRRSTRPSSPASTGSITVASEGTVSRRDSIMVTHNMQLPKCISSNGGNLDDFAAMMTCFFWFETMDTVRAAEQIHDRQTPQPLPPLSKYTEPCPSYKKWVNNVLSTTQVTQNVVLLALLFVYRLKKTNPKVNGNPGSEYRLLTVALMLGNKFLDDNTYTNKTWAEVSSISVKEIHVMEVEFLSNMRYGLLTSKEEWQDWLKKLSCYHEYCERAKEDERYRQAPPTISLSSPVHGHGRYSSPLPSPTSILPSTGHSAPSLTAAYSPNTAPSASWHSGYHITPSVSPLAAKPSMGYPMVRKRSLEGGDAIEPPLKRASRQPPVAVMPTTRATYSATYAPTESVRLPVPHLTLDTSQAIPPLNHGSVSYPSQSVGVSLPPLGPGVRAMATVYPTPTSSWAPQGQQVMASSGPQTPSYVVPSNYGTPTKRLSPTRMSAFGSSPLGDPYSTHTPISNSPSVYLQQRASPYKPVRRVNTLLNPPPSIPLSEYHLGSSQMHYQPLGRRNDVRSGIVPEFLPGSARPTHQGQAHQRYH